MSRSELIKKALKGTKDYHEVMLAILLTFSVQKPKKGQDLEEITAVYDGRYTKIRYHKTKREGFWDVIGSETIAYIKFKIGENELPICWKCANCIQDFIAYYISDTVWVRAEFKTPFTCPLCGEYKDDDIPF